MRVNAVWEMQYKVEKVQNDYFQGDILPLDFILIVIPLLLEAVCF